MRKGTPESQLQIADDVIHNPATWENGYIGYAPNFMGYASLPRRKVNQTEYVCINGNKRLSVVSPQDIGLPYSALSRVILVEITTRIKKSNTNEIYMGSSMCDFLRSIGIGNTGGKNGVYKRFKEQTKRILASTFIWTKETDADWSMEKLSLAHSANILWTPLEQGSWKTLFKFGDDDKCKLIESAIPVDKRVIYALSGNALAIDLYICATRVLYNLSSVKTWPWDIVVQQFGNTHKNTSQYKQRIEKAITTVKVFYPQANIKYEKGRITWFPSPPHVSTR